jgi:hypothetical protein
MPETRVLAGLLTDGILFSPQTYPVLSNSTQLTMMAPTYAASPQKALINFLIGQDRDSFSYILLTSSCVNLLRKKGVRWGASLSCALIENLSDILALLSSLDNMRIHLVLYIH